MTNTQAEGHRCFQDLPLAQSDFESFKYSFDLLFANIFLPVFRDIKMSPCIPLGQILLLSLHEASRQRLQAGSALLSILGLTLSAESIFHFA